MDPLGPYAAYSDSVVKGWGLFMKWCTASRSTRGGRAGVPVSVLPSLPDEIASPSKLLALSRMLLHADAAPVMCCWGEGRSNECWRV